MSHNPDEKYLKALLDDYKESLHLLFCDDMKSERERKVCRAFLRCAGIPFTEERIKAVPRDDDPPDVLFDCARFEVCLVLDECRKMHQEWKEKVQRIEKAIRDGGSIDDVSGDIPSRKPIRLAELVSLVTNALRKKFQKYAKDVRGKLDALVYINRHQTYFVPTSPGVFKEQFDTKSLDVQGWRSVSVLMSFSETIIDNQYWLTPPIPVTDSQLEDLDIQPPLAPVHAVVLIATPTAPKFLRDRRGKILNKCPDWKRLFKS